MELSVRLGEFDDNTSPTLVLPPAPQQSWDTKIWETSVTLCNKRLPQSGKSPSHGQDAFNLGITAQPGRLPSRPLWVVLQECWKIGSLSAGISAATGLSNTARVAWQTVVLTAMNFHRLGWLRATV